MPPELQKYHCPLCEQTVSKAVFERITGIWREKERRLAGIKNREAALARKEQALAAQFETKRRKLIAEGRTKERKLIERLTAKHSAAIAQERKLMQGQKQRIERESLRKIARVEARISKDFKLRQQERDRELRTRLESAKEAAVLKERGRLKEREDRFRRAEKLTHSRYQGLLKQFKSQQTRDTQKLEQQSKKIKSLEEQIVKNQSAQMLGLLEEGVFLKRLKEEYPTDRFEHPGKGGDILHFVTDKDKEVGTIVYELKKVARFSGSHVEQALEARRQRNGDYGLLVTNARRGKNDTGFCVMKGIMVVHPSAALFLVDILRSHLIQISRLKLNAEERKQSVRAVIEYVQGPGFRNSITAVIQDANDLYNDLKGEVEQHVAKWKYRASKYDSIHKNSLAIHDRINALGVEKKVLTITPAGFESIALPPKIG